MAEKRCKHPLLSKMAKTAAKTTKNALGRSPSARSPLEGKSTSLASSPSVGAKGTISLGSTSTKDTVGLDSETQLRSTLAIGQLIASNRPTAGSRLIASELSSLTSTIKDEAASLRKEISELSNNLATTLKTVLEEDREERNMGAAGVPRRPTFGPFSYRRFPVYRRPRRISLQFARKQPTTNASTSTSTSPNSSVSPMSPIDPSAKSIVGISFHPAPGKGPTGRYFARKSADVGGLRRLAAKGAKTTPETVSNSGKTLPAPTITGAPATTAKTSGPPATTTTAPTTSAKATGKSAPAPNTPIDGSTSILDDLHRMIIKNIWLPPIDRSLSTYDGEADSDDDSPSSTP